MCSSHQASNGRTSFNLNSTKRPSRNWVFPTRTASAQCPNDPAWFWPQVFPQKMENQILKTWQIMANYMSFFLEVATSWNRFGLPSIFCVSRKLS